MEQELRNDSHYTDSHYYRIPAEQQMISALGRALWNFLFIEEIVVAIIGEAGKDVILVRAEMAMGKQEALKDLKKEFVQVGAPTTVLAALEAGIDAFDIARKEYRNALTHAVPYVVSINEDGKYQPGLKMQGKTEQHDIKNWKDMHVIAEKIEQAINPLNAARIEVMNFMELRSK